MKYENDAVTIDAFEAHERSNFTYLALMNGVSHYQSINHFTGLQTSPDGQFSINDVMHEVEDGLEDETIGDNLVITGKRWKGSVTPEDVRGTWRTPPFLFSYFNDLVGGFDIDGAASEDNALCDEYYSKEDDALSFDWPENFKIWLNPPFSDPRPWIDHVMRQVRERGCLVCVVLPDDISTKWFRMCVDGAAEMYGLVSDGKKTGRVGFIHPTTGVAVRDNPKGSFVFIFRRHKSPLKTHWISRNEMEQANSDII